MLKQVPADYQVVLVIKSLDSLQKGVDGLVAKVKQPGQGNQIADLSNLSDMLAKWRGISFANVDRARAVVFVIPAVPVEEPATIGGALLLPVKDFDAFLTDNKAEAKGDQKVNHHVEQGTAGDREGCCRRRRLARFLPDDAKIAGAIAGRVDMSVAGALTADEKGLLDACQGLARVNIGPVLKGDQAASCSRNWRRWAWNRRSSRRWNWCNSSATRRTCSMPA